MSEHDTNMTTADTSAVAQTLRRMFRGSEDTVLEQGYDGGITRRRFVRDASVAAVAAADLLATTAPASSQPKQRTRQRPTVGVFGGGIAGLTAAHELAERGFDVTVYERRAWGGKARSSEVVGSGRDGRRNLPGEHAYRGEFGCYQSVSDTMKRIPFASNANGVFDNMVGVPRVMFARTRERDLILPLLSLDPRGNSPQNVVDFVFAIAVEMQLKPHEAAYFASRMAVFMSSSEARRHDDWERMSWYEFIGAPRFGEGYKRTLGQFWEFVQGTKSDETCTRYPGSVVESWLIYPLLGRGTTGPVLRMLDAPTNEAWIDPWVAHLRQLGVRLRLGSKVARLDIRRGRIEGALVESPGGRRVVRHDHYVCALPVEYARRLWSPAILSASPRLADMKHLDVGRYNGISYFLRERSRIYEGSILCADSPWSANFVTQQWMWEGDIAARYGDGTVADKLSAVVAGWDKPGVRYGKTAAACSPEELALDLFEQIKQHVNNPGQEPVLTDDMLHSWQIDPGIRRRRGVWKFEDRLVMPRVGTYQHRPGVETDIPNLFLSGDYLDGPWEIANMEAACRNGRRAANAILEDSSSIETPAATAGIYQPPEWQQLRRIDEDRYQRGQPNLFDADLTATQLKELLSGLVKR
ncbi:MAG TPA: FAD-dependent oxidoreductase [Solirubrobacteraceae bacterium]|nr:FAD-dependent oxidoreductase [Solirubrobacteraceae bacterium]